MLGAWYTREGWGGTHMILDVFIGCNGLYDFQMVFTIEGNKDEMVAALAAMICHDGKVELSAANIGAIATAAGTECTAAYATGFGTLLDATCA